MGRILEIGPASSEYYGEIEANNSIAKVFGPIPHFPAPISDLHYPLSDEAGRFNKSNHKTLIALAGISGTLAGCVQFGAQAQEVRDVTEYNSADPSQVPDQIAGEAAAVPESVGDRFDAFLNKYENADVGFDEITSLWVEFLGMSSDSIYDFLYDAGPFERFNNPPDYIKEKYEVILNDDWDKLPQKGDIIFTYPNSNNGAGIMVIAAEEAEVDSDGTRRGKVFANYNIDTLDFRSGWTPRVQDFNVENAIAWLRPILTNNSENSDAQVAEGNVIDAESEEGQVLGTESKKSIDELFDNFVKENEGVSKEKDSVLIWFDTLGISEEAISGYNLGKEVIENPTEVTKESFEVIPNGGDLNPLIGDIVIIKPISETSRGDIGVATGIVDGDLVEVFRHSELVSISVDEIEGLLRPEGYEKSVRIDGESEEGSVGTNGEVLGVNTKSMSEIYKTFFEKYNGQGVEKSDSSNFRQCVDLIWAFLDEMKIPRDSIRNFDPERPYASQIYTNADEDTRKDFEVVPYEEGMKLKLGDLAVWGEEVGSTAGHVAIATGKENIYFSQNYPIEEYPEDRKAHLQEISTRGLMGVLRPRGFSEGVDIQPPGEFVPKNESEFARYHFARFLMQYFNESVGGVVGYWTKWTGLSGNEIEKIIRDFAEKGTTSSIPIYEISYNTHHGTFSPPDPDLYLYDDNGDIYEQEMYIIKGSIKNPTIELSSPIDKPEPRNGYRVKWAGQIEFSSQLESGMALITARGTLEDFQRWGEGDSSFPGFDKITDTSLFTGGHTFFKVYIYEGGDVECESYFTGYNDLGVCLDQGRPSINNMFGGSAFFPLSDSGYNGEFVIEP